MEMGIDVGFIERRIAGCMSSEALVSTGPYQLEELLTPFATPNNPSAKGVFFADYTDGIKKLHKALPRTASEQRWIFSEQWRAWINVTKEESRSNDLFAHSFRAIMRSQDNYAPKVETDLAFVELAHSASGHRFHSVCVRPSHVAKEVYEAVRDEHPDIKLHYCLGYDAFPLFQVGVETRSNGVTSAKLVLRERDFLADFFSQQNVFSHGHDVHHYGVTDYDFSPTNTGPCGISYGADIAFLMDSVVTQIRTSYVTSEAFGFDYTEPVCRVFEQITGRMNLLRNCVLLEGSGEKAFSFDFAPFREVPYAK